jgi:hypothetical protein
VANYHHLSPHIYALCAPLGTRYVFLSGIIKDQQSVSSGGFSASTYSMLKVKLGKKEFDVNSEVLNASFCGISDADCVAFAARMKMGEISRVKTLYLVRFVFCTSEFPCVFSSMYVSADLRLTGMQPNRRRGSEIHRCCFAAERMLGVSVPCKMNIRGAFLLLNFRLSFHRYTIALI